MARAADRQARVLPPRVHLDLVDQRAYFGLHAGQPDHRVQAGEQLLDRVAYRVGRPSGRRFDDNGVGGVGELDRGLRGVRRTAGLDLAAAARAERDPTPASVVHRQPAQRRTASVSDDDSFGAGLGDLARLDHRPAVLVDVHAAPAALADRAAPDDRVGAEPDHQAVAGRLGDRGVDDLAAGRQHPHACLAAGDRAPREPERGRRVDHDGGRRAAVDLAALGDQRRAADQDALPAAGPDPDPFQGERSVDHRDRGQLTTGGVQNDRRTGIGP
jgi:hypothetical protein